MANPQHHRLKQSKYPPRTDKSKSQAFRLLGTLLSFLLTGCGYTLGHRLKDSFLNPKGIYVPVFENQTDEVGAERVFTNAIRRELQSRGEMVLASREEGALELQGVVRGIDYYPTAYSQPGTAPQASSGQSGLEWYRRLPTEFGVNVTLSLALINPKTKAVLWNQDFTDFRRAEAPADRTYDFQAPSSIPLLSQSLIEAVYYDIGGDISRDFYDAVVELF